MVGEDKLPDLGDMWDAILEKLEYIFTFEWFGDFWEFVTSGFEGMGEFSIYGIIFAAIASGFTFLVRSYTVAPFLVGMGGTEKLFWMIATYGGVFVGGYLLGKMFENSA